MIKEIIQQKVKEKEIINSDYRLMYIRTLKEITGKTIFYMGILTICLVMLVAEHFGYFNIWNWITLILYLGAIAVAIMVYIKAGTKMLNEQNRSNI